MYKLVNLVYELTCTYLTHGAWEICGRMQYVLAEHKPRDVPRRNSTGEFTVIDGCVALGLMSNSTLSLGLQIC